MQQIETGNCEYPHILLITVDGVLSCETKNQQKYKRIITNVLSSSAKSGYGGKRQNTW